MISGQCRTNLDGYASEFWPERFVAIPEIGQMVEAKSGRILKVCSVTHCIRWGNRDETPFVLVELTNSRGGAT